MPLAEEQQRNKHETLELLHTAFLMSQPIVEQGLLSQGLSETCQEHIQETEFVLTTPKPTAWLHVDLEP